MTRHVRVVYLDDIDGTEGAEEVKFTLNGTEYEIDLSEKNRIAMQKAMQPFIAKARSGQRRRRPAAQKV